MAITPATLFLLTAIVAPPFRPIVLDAQLEIEIRPAKTVWSPRESITGIVVWRNRSESALAIFPHTVFDVQIVDTAGATFPRFPAKMYLCGNFHSRSEVIVAPHEEVESSFKIDTDPLGMLGGSRVSEGDAQLVFAQPSWAETISTRVSAAAIEIRRVVGEVLSPRIVDFAVGGDRLAVLREDATMQLFDIDAHATVLSLRLDGYEPKFAHEFPFAVSPDGEWIATLDPLAPNSIEIRRTLAPAPPPLLIDVPAALGFDSRVTGVNFGADSRTLCITSNTQAAQIDCETGKLMVCRERVRWERAGVAGAFGPPSRIEMLPAAGVELPYAESWFIARPAGDVWGWFVGRSAMFLRGNRNDDTLAYDLNGNRLVTFPATAGNVYAASYDERFLLFSDDSPCLKMGSSSISVWEMNSARRVFEFPEDRLRVPTFTGDGRRLVCAAQGESVGLPVMIDEFELYESASGRLLRTLLVPPVRLDSDPW